MWRLLGKPTEFWVIEGGPGTGLFAADLLETAEAAFPRFAASLRLALIERAPRLRARQRGALGAWLDRVRWLEPSPDSWVALGCGCVFANELLDAFPVHRVVAGEDGPGECWVLVEEKRFREVDLPLSRPGLLTQMWWGGGKLPLHCRGEVSPEVPAWVQAAAGLIERGYMMLIDYGEPARTLYGRRHPLGTLRCYRDHVQVDDPLALPGLQDITAHVDLSAVTRAAEEAGLALLGATSQRTLLTRLGLETLERHLEGNASGRVERRAHRAAFRLLSSSKALGRLCALLFSKGAPAGLAALDSSKSLAPPDLPHLWRLRLDPAQLLASSENSPNMGYSKRLRAATSATPRK
jgi:SAM-dependent MidA family methyltransferase